MKKLTLAFDLDNTLVQNGTQKNHYLDAEPIQEMIDLVNMLYDEGHVVFLFTSRSYYHGQKEQEDCLRNQMGIKFHYLVMGKPLYDIFVDDRAVDWYDGMTKINVQILLDRIRQRQEEDYY